MVFLHAPTNPIHAYPFNLIQYNQLLEPARHRTQTGSVARFFFCLVHFVFLPSICECSLSDHLRFRFVVPVFRTESVHRWWCTQSWLAAYCSTKKKDPISIPSVVLLWIKKLYQLNGQPKKKHDKFDYLRLQRCIWDVFIENVQRMDDLIWNRHGMYSKKKYPGIPIFFLRFF